MTAPVRKATADTIPEGNRLVRVGGDRGLSLVEKVTWRLRQMHYRSFLHGLRLRGRFPLKLLAAPADLWVGEPLIGKALVDGRFDYMGIAINTNGIRFSAIHAPLGWLEWLHGFRWLRDAATVLDHRRGAAIIEPLVQRWLDEYARFDELVWRPDILGERLINWMTHAPFLLSSSDQVYRSAVLNTLARSGRHLAQTVEKTPNGLARVKAAAGLIVNGLLLPGGEQRRHVGERALARGLTETVLVDGGTIARCPSEHLEIVKLLLTVRQVYRDRQIEQPEALVSALDRMIPALFGLVLGDGLLSAAHGGSLGNAQELERIRTITDVATTPLRNGVHCGFQRLDGGDTVAVIDAGPPPPARTGTVSHAGTLSFEFSDGPHRVVVNCGGGRSAGLAMRTDLHELLRTTAAHSTLVIENLNSTKLRDDGTLDAGVEEVTALRQESADGVWLDCGHDGYAGRFGLEHRRRLYLSSDGVDLRGEDQLVGSTHSRWRKPRAGLSFDIRFHLGDGVEPTMTADHQGAVLKLPNGVLWAFKARGAKLRVDDSLWVDSLGKVRRTRQLVLTGDTAEDGAQVRWSFKRGTRS